MAYKATHYPLDLENKNYLVSTVYSELTTLYYHHWMIGGVDQKPTGTRDTVLYAAIYPTPSTEVPNE